MKKRLYLTLCLALCVCMLCASVALSEAGPVTLTMLDHSTPESAEDGNSESIIYNDTLNNWLAANPNVTLERESISHEVYETKVKTLAAANELPDIFMALPTYMKSFYNNGQIHDLRPIVEADSDWKSRYVNGSFGDYEYGDVWLGAPRIAIVNHLLLWNREIFKECGYDEFPATAEELAVAVEKIKEKGYIPMADGNKGQYMISSQIMPGILFKFASADWYAGIRNYEGSSFTDEAPLTAIRYLDNLMKNGLFNDDVNSIEPDQARQLYYSGRAAMVIEGSWVINAFMRETTDEIMDKTGITIWPESEAHPEFADQMVGGQGWGLCLSSKLESERLGAASQFLKGFTDPQIQAAVVEGGMVGIVKDIPYDESKLHPFYLKFLDTIGNYGTIMGCPEVQLSAEYMDASYVGYQELSIQAITPEELAQTLQDAHESAKP